MIRRLRKLYRKAGDGQDVGRAFKIYREMNIARIELSEYRHKQLEYEAYLNCLKHNTDIGLTTDHFSTYLSSIRLDIDALSYRCQRLNAISAMFTLRPRAREIILIDDYTNLCEDDFRITAEEILDDIENSFLGESDSIEINFIYYSDSSEADS